MEQLRNNYRNMQGIRNEIVAAFCHFLEGEEPTPPSPQDIVKETMVSVPPDDDPYDDCTLSNCVMFIQKAYARQNWP